MRIGRILLALGILVVVIFLIVLGFRAIFGRSGQPDRTTETSQQATDLTLYAGTGTVTYVQNGRIVAPENHYQITIRINASSRTVEVYNGYQGVSVHTETFANDQNSFNAFIAALQQTGFLSTRTSVPADASREGSCATGMRYSYQLSEGATTISDTWNTSCGKAIGTFAGNASQVRRLFQAQIPNYSQVTSKAKL